jgi:hypothetical protein
MAQIIRIIAITSFLFHALSHVAIAENLLLNELYEKSGLDYQVKQFPHLLQSGFVVGISQQNHDTQKITTSDIEEIKKIITEIFDPEPIKNSIIKHIEQELTKEDTHTVLAWLNSDPGKRCSESEINTSSAESIKEIQEYARKLQYFPPTKKRIEIIEKLNKASMATDYAVDIAIILELGIKTAIISGFQPITKELFYEISKEIEENRFKIKSDLQSFAIISSLYTYKSIEDKDLISYIDFLQSNIGIKYQKAAMSAIVDVFKDRSFVLGLTIVEKIKRHNPNTNKPT